MFFHKIFNFKNVNSLFSTILQGNPIRTAIIRNSFWLILGEVLSRFIRMFLILYPARLLGASEWGLYNYAFSFVGLASFFADIGLSLILTREIAMHKNKERETFASAWFVKMILLTITLIFNIIFYFVFLKTQFSLILFSLVLCSFLLDSMNSFMYGLARGLGKMHYEAIGSVLYQAVTLLAALSLLVFGPTSVNFAAAFLIGSLITFLLLFIAFKDFYWHLISKFNVVIYKEILHLCKPHAFTALFAAGTVYIDNTLLGLWLSSEMVGYYSASYKLVTLFLILPSILSSSLMPYISRHHQETNVIIKILEKIMRLFLLISLPLTLFLVLFSSETILLFYGPAYGAAVSVLTILAFSIPFNFVNKLLIYSIIALQKNKIYVAHCVITCLILVVFDLMLIPMIGIKGAAIGFLITQISATIYLFYKFKNILIFKIFDDFYKPLIALGLITVSALFFKYFLNQNIIFVGVAFFMLYGALLLIFKDKIFREFRLIS